MFAKSYNLVAGMGCGIATTALATIAQAQGSVLTNPGADEAKAQAGPGLPELIPGFNNTDLAFVAVMLIFLAGLIWMWMRGGSMQRQAELNASIISRAESRRSVVMDDEQLVAAEARDKASKNAEVQEMVSGRMGLRSSQ